MATIRPLQREDIPAVAHLVAEAMGWRRDAQALERTLIDHPWAPEPLPARVAVDEAGEVIGSIGAQARRVVFDGEALDAVCVSHLVVDPDRRSGAAGALLVRELLAGDQAITWTDSATEDVVRIWHAFGAHVDQVRTCSWMLILRAGGWLSRLVRPGEAVRRHALPVDALPLQVAGRRLVPRAFPPPPPDVHGEDASPEQVAELLPTLGRSYRFRVAYDAESLSWLFDYVDSLGSPLVCRVVRRGDEALGWYAYIRQPGVARLVHLMAAGRSTDAVFADLVADARRAGSALLTGRLEPHLAEPVRRRLGAVGLTQRPIVHTHDEGLRAALASSTSLLTEMDLIDSEWW